MILTPGAKRRFLEALATLRTYVDKDQEREVVMYWTSLLMPMVVSELVYYTPKKTTTKKH